MNTDTYGKFRLWQEEVAGMQLRIQVTEAPKTSVTNSKAGMSRWPATVEIEPPIVEFERRVVLCSLPG